MWKNWSSEHAQNGAGNREVFEANVCKVIETNREADDYHLEVNKFAGICLASSPPRLLASPPRLLASSPTRLLASSPPRPLASSPPRPIRKYITNGSNSELNHN